MCANGALIYDLHTESVIVEAAGSPTQSKETHAAHKAHAKLLELVRQGNQQGDAGDLQPRGHSHRAGAGRRLAGGKAGAHARANAGTFRTGHEAQRSHRKCT